MTQSTAIISIPTAARGAVRAYVKSLPGFDAFALSLGVASREVKNADLVLFATNQGKLDEVKAIIAYATGKPASPFTTERLDEAVEQQACNAKEDAAMEKLIAEGDALVAIVEKAQANVTRAFDLDAVLGGVDQLLSPLVRKEIEKALQPVIDAANKPAVEVERIVEVEAAPVAPAGQRPYAVRTGAQVSFNKLFGTSTSHGFGKALISLWNAHGAAPALDPYYVVDAANMGALATAAEHGSNLWAVGPSGSGKSTLPQQFAAFTGRPFVRINFTRQSEVADLVGGTGLTNGSTEWDDGVLIQAMKQPGTVILFDEPSFAPAGVAAIIQAVTDDHRSYTVHSTGEVVKCAPGVVFCVADNTNGSGDETGQYAGTNQQNTALVNRFARMIRVEYMSKAQETAALMNHCAFLPKAAAEHVTDFVSRARKLPDMEGVALSLRQMVGFCKMVKDGFPAKMAFDAAILTRLPPVERAAIETMVTLQWGEEFEQMLDGTFTPSQPEPTSAGAQAFDDEVSATLNRS